MKENIIKRLRDCLTNKYLTINFYPDNEEMCFEVWENPAYIMVNFGTKEVYLDSSLSQHHLTSDMLAELNVFVKMAELGMNELMELM